MSGDRQDRDELIVLNILSLERGLMVNERVRKVQFPGSKGNFVVLKNHAALISSLEEGYIIYTKGDGEEFQFNIKKGFVEIENNKIDVCVEEAEEKRKA